MKRTRLFSGFLTVILLLCSLLPALADQAGSRGATVLFTHDLHSHFLPQTEGNRGATPG